MSDTQSGEIRASEVFLSGRVTRGPNKTADGNVHYLLDTGLQHPLHLIASDKQAEVLTKYVGAGDETLIEGSLEWVDFPDTGATLIIKVRYASYGTKARGNREIADL